MIHSVHELSVLLVEPSAMQRKIIAEQLRQLGVFQVDGVASGGEALQALRKGARDLTVSAMYLPDMTGTELVQAMRADPATAGVPFILVSSESRAQVLEPVRQSGVCGILPKPFSQEQLATALRATLDLLGPESHLGQDGVALDGIRVLLVDDSPMARRFIRQVLERMGIDDFLEAENGRQAVDILAEAMVDLVVTDYNMPEMDGKALIDYIRTQSWQNTVPVLMVTSEADEGRLAAVHGMGVVGVCDKPFQPATVRALLNGLLK